MNTLLALSGLKSEAQCPKASTSAQTASTCLAESAESSSGEDLIPAFWRSSLCFWESNRVRNGSLFSCALGI